MTNACKRMRWIRGAVLLAVLAGCTSAPETPDEVAASDGATVPADVVQLIVSDDASRLPDWDLSDGMNRIFAGLHESIPGPPVRVLVHVVTDAELAHGIAARTDPDSGDISVAVSPRLAELDRQEALLWLRRVLAHEFHHSRRVTAGPGFGGTVGEWLVSEGLADLYASEVDPTFEPFAFRQFDRDAFEADWSRIEPQLDDAGGVLDYRQWFAEDDGRVGAGYGIGLEIVNTYLGRESSSPADSVAVPAGDVLASFGSPSA